MLRTLETSPPILKGETRPAPLSASDRIRYRLIGAGCRYHANDNISAFIKEGELDELKAEVQSKMQEVLHALVIDTQNDHNTNGTAERVARMFLTEVFRGRYVPMPAVTEFPNASHLNQLMIVGPITVRSACSHHLCPIMGKVWIGILPNEHSNLIGLSKYARICDWIMGRPQIQEEAITMLADELEQARQARRPGPGDGVRSLLHALARRERQRCEHDQQRDARRLPEGRHAAPRVPVPAEQEERLSFL